MAPERQQVTAGKEQRESKPFNRRTAVAAGVFCGLALLVVAFQLALAAGAPWGRLTMGGVYPDQLPQAMRVAAFVQALLLLIFAIIVAMRARLVLPRWHRLSRKLVWLVVAYTIVGAVLNAITPSAGERALWLPVVVVLAICVVVVARTE
jgi:magnesium-transporting ATPase (P-type)